ncbi:Uma2 family endonuclease [Microcoleus sp. AT3-A2]|uniref:Uma2 family endonuclease n=1 Tax=Microcoleus sp. AT3-A2 TaxID=2818610 RepID=UPI002FD32AC0
MSQSIVPAVEDKQIDTSPTLTFEEYRVYQSNDDVQYELYKGKLIPMATASALHTSICEFWVYKLQRYLAEYNLDLVVKTSVGVRTEDATSRIPDVVVCTESLWQQVLARPGSGILDLSETPLFVVEVVSQDRRADYVLKRTEYEQANVPEYVIVDPTQNRQRVRVMAFPEGDDVYTQVDYLPGEEIISVVFPNMRLSVNEILDPPLVEGLIKAEQAQLQQLQTVEQRAERLAARLRELGIDPDAV